MTMAGQDKVLQDKLLDAQAALLENLEDHDDVQNVYTNLEE